MIEVKSVLVLWIHVQGRQEDGVFDNTKPVIGSLANIATRGCVHLGKCSHHRQTLNTASPPRRKDRWVVRTWSGLGDKVVNVNSEKVSSRHGDYDRCDRKKEVGLV